MKYIKILLLLLVGSSAVLMVSAFARELDAGTREGEG